MSNDSLPSPAKFTNPSHQSLLISKKVNMEFANTGHAGDVLKSDGNSPANVYWASGDESGAINAVFPITNSDYKRRKEANTKRKSGKASGTDEHYDIIIVGAGTAGSCLCYNMAKKYPNKTILLCDMGRDDSQDDQSLRIGGEEGAVEGKSDVSAHAPENDWGGAMRSLFGMAGDGAAVYHGEARSRTTDESIGGGIHQPMAGTLGGNSSTNAMWWNRGTDEGTYKRWRDATGETVMFNDAMSAAYNKIENRSQTTRIYGLPAVPMFPGSAESGPINISAALDADHLLGPEVKSLRNVLENATGNPDIDDLLHPDGDHRIIPNLNEHGDLDDTERVHTLNYSAYDQSDPYFKYRNPYTSLAGLSATIDGCDRKLDPNYRRIKKLRNARSFAAPAFLYPIRHLSNVTIKTETLATKLLFSEDDETEVIGVEFEKDAWHVLNARRQLKRDTRKYQASVDMNPLTGLPASGSLGSGIDWQTLDTSDMSREQAVENQTTNKDKDNGNRFSAYADADVWVCLGSINTPKLLQLSGIGDAAHLESMIPPIQCKAHLPGVGKVQDTLDMLIVYNSETELATHAPLGFPQGTSNSLKPFLFGASTVNPFHSISNRMFYDTANGGKYGVQTPTSDVAFNCQASIKIKTNKAKPYIDMDLVQSLPIAASLGNLLWNDQSGVLSGRPSAIDFSKSRPNWDRFKNGYQSPAGSSTVNLTAIFTEYWDMISRGDVKIQTSSPYDLANYAPALLDNEDDIKAMVDGFRDTILPMLQGLGSQRMGARGTHAWASHDGSYANFHNVSPAITNPLISGNQAGLPTGLLTRFTANIELSKFLATRPDMGAVSEVTEITDITIPALTTGGALFGKYFYISRTTTGVDPVLDKFLVWFSDDELPTLAPVDLTRTLIKITLLAGDAAGVIATKLAAGLNVAGKYASVVAVGSVVTVTNLFGGAVIADPADAANPNNSGVTFVVTQLGVPTPTTPTNLSPVADQYPYMITIGADKKGYATHGTNHTAIVESWNANTKVATLLTDATTEELVVWWSTGARAAAAEVTEITIPALNKDNTVFTGANLCGKYFFISRTATNPVPAVDNYCVWFGYTANNSPFPEEVSNPYKALIKIEITSDMSAGAIAGALAGVLNGVYAGGASAVGLVVTVTDPNMGFVNEASACNSGLTLERTAIGKAAIVPPEITDITIPSVTGSALFGKYFYISRTTTGVDPVLDKFLVWFSDDELPTLAPVDLTRTLIKITLLAGDAAGVIATKLAAGLNVAGKYASVSAVGSVVTVTGLFGGAVIAPPLSPPFSLITFDVTQPEPEITEITIPALTTGGALFGKYFYISRTATDVDPVLDKFLVWFSDDELPTLAPVDLTRTLIKITLLAGDAAGVIATKLAAGLSIKYASVSAVGSVVTVTNVLGAVVAPPADADAPYSSMVMFDVTQPEPEITEITIPAVTGAYLFGKYFYISRTATDVDPVLDKFLVWFSDDELPTLAPVDLTRTLIKITLLAGDAAGVIATKLAAGLSIKYASVSAVGSVVTVTNVLGAVVAPPLSPPFSLITFDVTQLGVSNNLPVFALNSTTNTPLTAVDLTEVPDTFYTHTGYYQKNNRNFARLVSPNGDEIFSDYQTIVSSGAVRTPAYLGGYTNVITITAAGHGLLVGDIIKISGATGLTDPLTAELNNYHLVDTKTDDTFTIVLVYNPTPNAGPTVRAIPPAFITETLTGSLWTIHKLAFDESKFKEWLRRAYFSGWHPCCSARMGKPEDLMAVVDTCARVFKTKGLRITDGSILPTKPNCNTQAPIYAITQALSDKIQEEEYDKFFADPPKTTDNTTDNIFVIGSGLADIGCYEYLKSAADLSLKITNTNTNPLAAPPSVLYEGLSSLNRFADGKIWVDYLADMTEYDVVNIYDKSTLTLKSTPQIFVAAVGGAMSNSHLYPDDDLASKGGYLWQVEKLVERTGNLSIATKSNSLFVVDDLGGNDIIDLLYTAPIDYGTKKLAAAGSADTLITNLYNMGARRMCITMPTAASAMSSPRVLEIIKAGGDPGPTLVAGVIYFTQLKKLELDDNAQLTPSGKYTQIIQSIPFAALNDVYNLIDALLTGIKTSVDAHNPGVDIEWCRIDEMLERGDALGAFRVPLVGDPDPWDPSGTMVPRVPTASYPTTMAFHDINFTISGHVDLENCRYFDSTYPTSLGHTIYLDVLVKSCPMLDDLRHKYRSVDPFVNDNQLTHDIINNL